MSSRRARRFVGSLLFLFSVLFACNSPASAQADLNYPNKTIRIVVGFTPGGAPDLTARVIAQKLSALWGQPVIVENRPGAGSALAAEHVAHSPADGYTLFSITDAHAVVAALDAHLKYDPVKDFAPITLTSTASNWVLVSSSLGVKTLAELIAYAKANPGKLNFPSAGVGSFSHFGTALFNDRVGIEAQHIPFKGIPEALTEISAGRAHYMVAPVSISSGLVRDGTLIPVAVTSKQRLAAYPDIPTVAESGFPGFEKLTMSALIAPAHTPPEIIAKLNKAVSNIIDQDDVKKQWAQIGVDPAHDTPEQLQAIISNEVTTFTEAAQRAHITAE